MTVFKALAILEAAVLECKKREISTRKCGKRWSCWSRIFNRSGWFRRQEIVGLNKAHEHHGKPEHRNLTQK
jgi:hypothetical protein